MPGVENFMIIQTAKPVPSRHVHDFYATDPAFCKQAVAQLRLQDFYSGARNHFETPQVLDPGCGTGVWGQAILDRWPHAVVDGVEIRNVDRPQGYRYLYGGDFRLMDHGLDYDLILGNPPYYCAEAFVHVGLANLNENGRLFYLLPLRFLEGKARMKGLFRKTPPRTVQVVGRVSFSGDKRTNATAYALYTWQRGWSGDTQLTWLYK